MNGFSKLSEYKLTEITREKVEAWRQDIWHKLARIWNGLEVHGPAATPCSGNVKGFSVPHVEMLGGYPESFRQDQAGSGQETCALKRYRRGGAGQSRCEPISHDPECLKASS